MIRRKKPIRRSRVKRVKSSKPKKPSLTAYKKKLWKKLSDYIKKRDGNTCFVCGAKGLSGSNWHAAHVFSAGSYSALRWRLDNIFSGCYSCNIGKKGNYIEYHRRYKEKFGEAAYNDLYEHRRDVVQWRLPDLQEVEAKIDSLIAASNK